MRKLLNTLYILQETSYLSLDGENIVVLQSGQEKFRIPFCNIENIVCFSYLGASPALMGKCAEENVSLHFMRPNGRFLARVTGEVKGNVLLRLNQFKKFNDAVYTLNLAKNTIAAKIHNQRLLLARFVRDHIDSPYSAVVREKTNDLSRNIEKVYDCDCLDSLRGIEGESARLYYMVFDHLILKNKEQFMFSERTRRPPLDRVNAMLSFFYTILSFDVQSALETVGLDPYVGFFHTLRPGRAALSLDLMEELRAGIVDKFVLNLINLQQINPDDFLTKEGGAVLFTEEGKKKLLKAWQERKNEIFLHPIINEKIPFGLIPYVQAQLFAKHLRGDAEEYSPYLYNG